MNGRNSGIFVFDPHLKDLTRSTVEVQFPNPLLTFLPTLRFKIPSNIPYFTPRHILIKYFA